MKDFNLKMKTSYIEVELNIAEFEENDKDFVREIIHMIDRKTIVESEKEERKMLKETYIGAAKGYNELACETAGFHQGIDEYIAREVEEEINEKEPEEDINAKIKNDQLTNYKEQFEILYNESDIEESEENEKEKIEVLAKERGIRLNSVNKEIYQTFYICPKCYNKGKRYLPKQAYQINCHSCFYNMRLKPATSKGFPTQDKYGNFFVAGDFDPDIAKED